MSHLECSSPRNVNQKALQLLYFVITTTPQHVSTSNEATVALLRSAAELQRSSPHLSYSLHSFKGSYGDSLGEYYRVKRGILGVKTIAHI